MQHRAVRRLFHRVTSATRRRHRIICSRHRRDCVHAESRRAREMDRRAHGIPIRSVKYQDSNTVDSVAVTVFPYSIFFGSSAVRSDSEPIILGSRQCGDSGSDTADIPAGLALTRLLSRWAEAGSSPAHTPPPPAVGSPNHVALVQIPADSAALSQSGNSPSRRL